jgi:D-aminopeptidase
MAADATEQAVLDAMLAADTVVGFQQHARLGLTAVLDSLVTRKG